MDIGWLLDACPGNYNIEYTDGNVSFYQGGENNRYLYVYFPHGIGNDTYAENGYFTITTTLSRTMDSITIRYQLFFGSRTAGSCTLWSRNMWKQLLRQHQQLWPHHGQEKVDYR